MKTFEQFTTGYLAYTLTAKSRNDLLQHFKPKYPEVICDHVTYKFPAKSSDALPPAVHNAYVIGHADSEDGIEALVVEINGKKTRPDGKLFHITLSLDKSKGKKPVHSNDLLKSNQYKHVPQFTIHLEPEFLR